MSTIKIPKRVFQTLLLESFRYCLGRTSYAVRNCVETLELYWYKLPIEWRIQIQGDIKRAIETEQAGMDCDIKDWQKILKLPINGTIL